MIGELSANTQAILLLTAPLVVGRGSIGERPLSGGEYGRLAMCLRELRRQPADLLTNQLDDVLLECAAVIEEARVRRLLERGFLMS